MLTLSADCPAPQRTAVAVGVFDGVHLGHRAVIRAAVENGGGLLPCVFTFAAASIPRKQDRPLSYLYEDAQKQALLAQCGVEAICSPPFPDVAQLAGEAFAKCYLRELLQAELVVCGADFRFGTGAACGITELQAFGEAYGFQVQVVAPVTAGDAPVSSQEIRARLQAGDTAGAAALLGAPYRMRQVVSHGNEVGRTLGFPTINQFFGEGQCMPKRGVYASMTQIGGCSCPSVTNIGLRPTVGDLERPIAETHILDWEGSLYGETITVELGRFIRPEREFGSLVELRAQLLADSTLVRLEATSHRNGKER